MSAINASIDGMTETLDPEVKMNFMRLYKKDHIVLAPMNDGSCSMCGMHVAISQIQAVKLCRNLIPCPSCARTMYDPSGAKWVAERKSRSSSERKVGIARFSAPDLMLPDLQGTTSTEIIAELTQNLQRAQFVDHAEKLAAAAIARENILGTGIGHGMAFPHVRGIEGGGLSLAFGVSKKGVKFGGISEDPAHFIFFSTIPTAVSAFYLRLLAGLSESFVKEANRKLALEAKTPEELWKVLTKATRYTVK
jgi:mannitol/fructose-specific phosphotransferase system IIA component (Ntr-type)